MNPAGKGENRHDVMIIIMRSEEQVTDRWDSTLVKERLEEFAAHVAPDHPVLGKAVECSEADWKWGTGETYAIWNAAYTTRGL